MADNMNWNDGFLHWDILFTRSINDWEGRDFAVLLGVSFTPLKLVRLRMT